MERHLKQAKENLAFHDCIHTAYADLYYDWKITSLFYCAFHYMHALAKSKGKDLSRDHLNMVREIDPERKDKKIDLPPAVYAAYREMKRLSELSRYDGILQEPAVHTVLMKANYEKALKQFSAIKGFMKRPTALNLAA